MNIFERTRIRREREAGLEGETPAVEKREEAAGEKPGDFSFSKGRPPADPEKEAAKRAALLRLLRSRRQ